MPEPPHTDPSADSPSESDAPTSPATAGAEVRPVLSPAERRRRRRVLLQSMGLTFVLITAWIAVMIGFQIISRDKYDFRAETQEVLQRIRDNEVDALYADASPRLRRGVNPERFAELIADVRAVFGDFRQILAIKRVGEIDEAGSRAVRVKVNMEFTNGRTTGHFSYHQVDGTWRLLELSIAIPEDLGADAIARSDARLSQSAPLEVHELVERILERASAGDSAAIYDAAAPPFRGAISRDAFLALQEQRARALGRFVRIMDIIESRRNGSFTSADVVVAAQYQKAETRVTMKFYRVDGEWKLGMYKVILPLPGIPENFAQRP